MTFGIHGLAAAAPPTPVYIAKAGASDLYERRASQVVLASSRDRGVRRFAEMMVADHSQSTAKVKAAAERSGFRVRPPMLEPRQRQMIADLEHARGRDRDRLYVQQQRMAHREALSLHRDYASTGEARRLARVAGEIVPVVQHHIQMLDRM